LKLAFVNKLIELAEQDPRIMLLTGDLGFQIFDDFQNRFGSRFVNVGVAEAQMVCAAAGLAFVGWKPVTYSIASFMTSRCYEQIKISVAYPHLPVVIVGAGGGFAYGSSGVTHHAADDIALMSSIPGLSIVLPGDPNEVEQLLPQIFKLSRPTYFRIGRGKEPLYEVKDPAVLGQARLLHDGQDIAILSTGDIASEVLSAVKALNCQEIFPIAYQFHTIKPLDTITLGNLLKKTKHIITVEEHISHGGLNSAVRGWLSTQKNTPELIGLSADDEFVLGSPEQHEIRSKCGINDKAIVDEVLRLSKNC
jgi:transketolase